MSKVPKKRRFLTRSAGGEARKRGMHFNRRGMIAIDMCEKYRETLLFGILLGYPNPNRGGSGKIRKSKAKKIRVQSPQISYKLS